MKGSTIAAAPRKRTNPSISLGSFGFDPNLRLQRRVESMLPKSLSLDVVSEERCPEARVARSICESRQVNRGATILESATRSCAISFRAHFRNGSLHGTHEISNIRKMQLRHGLVADSKTVAPISSVLKPQFARAFGTPSAPPRPVVVDTWRELNTSQK